MGSVTHLPSVGSAILAWLSPPLEMLALLVPLLTARHVRWPILVMFVSLDSTPHPMEAALVAMLVTASAVGLPTSVAHALGPIQPILPGPVCCVTLHA